MKPNFIFLIIYSFSFFLLICSCTKEQEKIKNNSNTYYDYIDPEMNDFSFQYGSYWIYKNDSLNKTDCTYLINNLYLNYYWYHGLGYTTIVEYRQLWYHDQLFPGKGYRAYMDGIWGRAMIRNLTFPPYYVVKEEFLVYSLDTTSSIKRFDSLKVGNVTYKDVQMSVYDSNTYYYAKGVGLIKKIMMDSTHVRASWNLIRWKIVK